MQRTCHLNDYEISTCRWLATGRHSGNRTDNVKNSKIGPQSNDFTDWNGLCGELAFCKLLNLYPAGVFDVNPRSAKKGQDKGGDIILRSGLTVDVKTTKRTNGRLLTPIWKRVGTVDLLALMVGDVDKSQTFTYIGYMCESDLIQSHNVINLGYGSTYGVTQDKLCKMYPE
jgi:hypothetical protein